MRPRGSKWKKETTGSARVVVKGSNDNETFNIACSDDDWSFTVRDANGTHYGEGNDIPAYEWIHLAGTYDGSIVKTYINGEFLSRQDANFVLAKGWHVMEDSNGLAIGNVAEDLEKQHRQFRGTIDDVRVYDYGLSYAEVAWLAGDGSEFIPLESEANLYIGLDPQKIDFRDYAAIFDYWLEEKKWPAPE